MSKKKDEINHKNAALDPASDDLTSPSSTTYDQSANSVPGDSNTTSKEDAPLSEDNSVFSENAADKSENNAAAESGDAGSVTDNTVPIVDNSESPIGNSASAYDGTMVMPVASASAPVSGSSSEYLGAHGMMPVNTKEASRKPKKKHSVLKGLGITLGVIVLLLVVAYCGVALYFTDRFMPYSNAGSINLSYMSASEAEEALSDTVKDYSLSIKGDDFSLELTSSDTGLSIDTTAVVDSMLEDYEPWLWPNGLFKDYDESDKLVATVNGGSLTELVSTAVDEFNENAQKPTDASIVYDNDAQTFVVTPELVGTALDANKVAAAADEALSSLSSKVTLDEEDLLQPAVFSDDPTLLAALDKANAMLTTDVTFTLGNDVVATVDASLISKWILLNDDLEVSFDNDALSAWATSLARDCDTVGTTRSYTRPDGKSITVSGGYYGWTVDTDELIATVQSAIENGIEDTMEVPCSSTAAVFNGLGAADWGSRYCDVDLSEQHVYFYDSSGALIWESDCVSGLPNGERDTPTGVYYVNDKESPSVLIGYENGQKSYESEVTYWMPFVGNSVGLHDATWQSAFGGDRYKTYGSHGCVNLPYDKAQALYGIIEIGDVVVSHW